MNTSSPFNTFVDKESLQKGSYKEHKISFEAGIYSFAVKDNSGKLNMALHLEIFSNWGQRVATDDGNMMPGSCFLAVPEKMDLKFRVRLDTSSSVSSITYRIQSFKNENGRIMMI